MLADLILHGGRVHTLDPRQPAAEGIAFLGSRVLCVGPDALVLSLRGPETRCYALQGRTVLPGFVDCHVHFTDWALARRQLDLTRAATLEIALQSVADRASRTPAGSWIVGQGFDANLWADSGWPSARDLDRVAPGHPVFLSSKDLHSCWVSSLALSLAGVSSSTPDPDGGVIRRDPRSGEPSGILQERAVELVTRHLPRVTVEDTVQALQEAFPFAWAAGLTGVHEIHDTPEALSLRAHQALRQRGQTGLRVLHSFPLEHLESALQLGIQTGLGDELLRLGGVKLFADGALGSRTAHLLAPYLSLDEGGRHNQARRREARAELTHNEPRRRETGVEVLNAAALEEIIERADRGGIAVNVHAIGDRANRQVLDAFEAVLERAKADQRPRRADLRHRIEHVQLLDPDDLPRLARLGLVASMQPIHATSDMLIAERHWGHPRVRLAYAWRSVLESGAALCFGSDAPVEPFSVLMGIHAAVTRRRPDGSPGPEGWIPEQRLTPLAAVQAYTLGAAYASGEEALRGSLSPGKLGDAVVLSRDILTCPPEEIPTARVELTIVGGRVVHQS